MGLAIVETGGARSFLLVLVAPTLLINFMRLPPRPAALWAAASFGVQLAPLMLVDGAGVVEFPWLVVTSLVSSWAVVAMAWLMADAELTQQADATLDQLTGLLNRRSLGARFAELTEQASVMSDAPPIAVVLGDIDHFKQINDAQGHQHGDAVLVDVAYILRRHLRRFELAYRLGGDEFLILLPGQNEAAAADIAEAARHAIEETQPAGIVVTVSFGVAAQTTDAADLRALVAEADRALYQAKKAGRNTVVRSSALAAFAPA
jgi:diguanylate cyclase (GGDEF)-like protein